MSQQEILALLLVLALLVMIVVLAMAESALTHTSVIRAEALADEEPKRAARLQVLLETPEQVLNPLRLVILSAQLVEMAIVTALALRWTTTAVAVGVIAVNVAVVFLAEVGPRTQGVLHADRYALALSGPVARTVGSPPVRLLARSLIGIANVVVPGKGLPKGPFAHAEEFIALADAAVQDAVIEPEERDLIESVIEFGDTIVRGVMVPRTDMTTVDGDLTIEQALEISSLAGYSRLPVVGVNVDDVLGLAYVKDLIRAELDDNHEDPSPNVASIMRAARFVPETKRVNQLLREMQQESFHMAIVVDEYGGVAGLVTLEDLIEELVGEIVDEYDVEESLVERQPDGSLRVDGKLPIDELNDLAGLDFSEGEYDTVAGLVFDRFGRVPLVGESCETDGYILRVERVQARRITRVHVMAATNDRIQQEANS